MVVACSYSLAPGSASFEGLNWPSLTESFSLKNANAISTNEQYGKNP